MLPTLPYHDFTNNTTLFSDELRVQNGGGHEFYSSITKIALGTRCSHITCAPMFPTNPARFERLDLAPRRLKFPLLDRRHESTMIRKLTASAQLGGGITRREKSSGLYLQRQGGVQLFGFLRHHPAGFPILCPPLPYPTLPELTSTPVCSTYISQRTPTILSPTPESMDGSRGRSDAHIRYLTPQRRSGASRDARKQERERKSCVRYSIGKEGKEKDG